MNREYNCKVSSKNSKRLLKNLQNTTGDYFFCRTLYISDSSNFKMLKLHTVRWFSRPWRKNTAIAENHSTRPRSR